MENETQTVQDEDGFLWIGGHAAVDFANTRIIAHGVPTDLLTDADAAIRWTRAAGFLPGDLTDANAGDFLGALRSLRDGVRDALDALAAGNAVPDAARETLNRYMAAQTGYFVLRGDAPFALAFQEAGEAGGGTSLLAGIARNAAEFLATMDVSRLRKCESPACILLFYDTSKNGTRRWCRMRACGNRAKAAAHYQKTREAKA